jgi:hypothetical protein
MKIKHSFLLFLILGLAWASILFAQQGVTPQITNISTSPNPPLANQMFSFTITGSNFDSGGVSVTFTGPGCTNGCLGSAASIVPAQIIGTAQLPAGSFSVVVRNTNTGAPSNSVTLGVTTAVPFTLNNLSGTTQSTDGSGNLAVGYGTIQAAAGNTTPSGVLIFGYRQNNVLVTESGVPASPAIQSGRIFARVSSNSGPGSVNTGIAIVNPNASFANVAFHFANAAGDILGSGTCVIGPNKAIGQFLNESSPCPFNMSSIQGTFTFTSNVPVSAVALRSFIPEDGLGALYSTLPVVDTSVFTGTDPLGLAHFADGTEWTTEVVLVNPTGNTLTGTLQFLVDGLNPFTAIATDKGTQNSFSYSIPRESSYTLKTLGRSNPLAVGSVRITPATGVAAPSAMLIFSHKPGGSVTVADAGVPSVQGTAFRMYYELSGTGPGSVQSAVAVANLAPGPTSVLFELYNIDGSFVATGQSQVLGNGHVAKSVDELFPGITIPKRGILRIVGSLPGLSVVGIRSRFNESNKYLFTTTPATNELPSSPPTSAPLYFPRLVNGGSWSTQYVLFSGTVGQASTGVLQFYDTNGAAITLPLN